MTEKSIPREALLASFGNLETKFTSSLKKAQALEQAFDDSRAKLVQAISSHLHNAQESMPKANPLQTPLSNFVATMEKTSREWDAKVAGRQKGVKFRQGFEDSLLVFVSGKVKSGKSSLGNYIAWGHTDPTDETKRQTPPERYPKYKSHAKVDVKGGDSLKEAEKRCEFRVGATEAIVPCGSNVTLNVGGASGMARIALETMRSTYQELEHMSPSLTQRAGELLVDMVHLSLQDLAGQSTSLTQRQALHDRICAYVSTHLRDPSLSVQTVATALNCSKRHVHNGFVGQDISLGAFILRSRLELCMRELRQPELSQRTITDIAMSCGFSNSAHFSRAFKAYVGMSPSEYRNTTRP